MRLLSAKVFYSFCFSFDKQLCYVSLHNIIWLYYSMYFTYITHLPEYQSQSTFTCRGFVRYFTQSSQRNRRHPRMDSGSTLCVPCEKNNAVNQGSESVSRSARKDASTPLQPHLSRNAFLTACKTINLRLPGRKLRIQITAYHRREMRS